MLQASVRKQLDIFALDVCFSLPSQGITVLWGASGSGKSTLLQCIAGLMRPEKGSIVCGTDTWFDASTGVCVAPEKRRLGYVFQDVRLFPHFSVQGNLTFGQRFRGTSGIQLDDVVELLHVRHLLHRKPHNLSGGEKQRVAIGRALLASPDLLLMDEPLTGLDKARRQEILAYIKRIPQVLGIPILYVTHAEHERALLADRVLHMEDGRITATVAQ